MTPPKAPAAGIRNAFTIDVEDYFQVEGFANVVARSSWDSYPTRVEANTHRVLEMLEGPGVKATFFVLGWVAERYPELIRSIALAGHEIASHGMSHTLVYTQSPDVFQEETRRSKDILEQISQRPVVGYRAATYSITSRSAWALQILGDLGFLYDSSIFPIRHDRYGVMGAPRFLHTITLPGGGKIVEFPITTVRVLGTNLPVGGGGYFRLLPYSLSAAGLRTVNGREGQPFIFYIHPWEIDPGQPRIPGARGLSTFRHRVNLGRNLKRLTRLLHDFPFGTVREVIERQHPPLTPSYL